MAPLFAERQRHGVEAFSALSVLPSDLAKELVGDAVRAALPPSVVTAIKTATEAIDALALEVWNVSGQELAGMAVDVVSWKLFDSMVIDADARRWLEAEAARQDIQTSGYVLTLTQRP